MAEFPIIVAGAGIAGVAAAIGLGRHGLPVRVVERSPHFSEVGAGVQIGPNAIKALRDIGAWEAVEPLTCKPHRITVFDGVTSKPLQQIDLGNKFEQRYGAPYCVAHRADLHQALVAVAKSHDSVSLMLGEDAEAHVDHATPLVLAADGVHSNMRRAMVRNADARQLPYTIHRALLPSSAVGYLQDSEAVHLWLFPGVHAVLYRVKIGLINVVVVSDGVDAIVPEQVIGRVLGKFADVQAFSAWPALVVPPLKTWHDERTCLIGDAAHGTLPFLAQGAAMALEDAAAYARCHLANAANGARFAAFETLRRQRTKRLHEQTLAMGRIYHMRGLAAAARNAVLRISPASQALRRVDWIYRTKNDMGKI